MTAPDDVRARFDTWHDQRWPEPDNYRHKVDWRSAKHAKWTVWLAAHADLSGEVRELVEALDGWRVFESGGYGLTAFHPEYGEARGDTRDKPATQWALIATLRDVIAALAKFTQEKP